MDKKINIQYDDLKYRRAVGEASNFLLARNNKVDEQTILDLANFILDKEEEINNLKSTLSAYAMLVD